MWPIIGPPKLAPEGGPGPGGQSEGTWTLDLVLARQHDGVESAKVSRSAPIILPGVCSQVSGSHATLLDASDEQHGIRPVLESRIDISMKVSLRLTSHELTRRFIES